MGVVLWLYSLFARYLYKDKHLLEVINTNTCTGMERSVLEKKPSLQLHSPRMNVQ